MLHILVMAALAALCAAQQLSDFRQASYLGYTYLPFNATFQESGFVLQVFANISHAFILGHDR